MPTIPGTSKSLWYIITCVELSTGRCNQLLLLFWAFSINSLLHCQRSLLPSAFALSRARCGPCGASIYKAFSSPKQLSLLQSTFFYHFHFRLASSTNNNSNTLSSHLITHTTTPPHHHQAQNLLIGNSAITTISSSTVLTTFLFRKFITCRWAVHLLNHHNFSSLSTILHPHSHHHSTSIFQLLS